MIALLPTSRPILDVRAPVWQWQWQWHWHWHYVTPVVGVVSECVVLISI